MTFLKQAAVLFVIGSPQQQQQRYNYPLQVSTLSEYDAINSNNSILPPMTVHPVDKSKYEALVSWLKSTGAFVHDTLDIQPSNRGIGYGAFVTQAIEQGELLFTVPRSACISMDQVKADPQHGDKFQKFMKQVGPGGNTVVMAGYLAKEYLLSNDSDDAATTKFRPYFDTLPWERGINSQEHVLFWDKDQVDTILKGSFCFKESTELRSEVDLAITVLNSIVGPSIREARGEELPNGFRFPWQPPPQSPNVIVEDLSDAIKGAFVTLLTRGFEDDDNTADKLVPLLDMLQHSDEPNISHAMKKSDGTVEVRAKRNINPGEELLNQYRSEEEDTMPFHRFFTRFGFVPGILEPVENLFQDKSSIFYPKVLEV